MYVFHIIYSVSSASIHLCLTELITRAAIIVHERQSKSNKTQLNKKVANRTCMYGCISGFVVNGVNNVNTQTVERRFRLPSSKSGLISSSYDFSAAIVGAFISFIGTRYSLGSLYSMDTIITSFNSSLSTSIVHHIKMVRETKNNLSRVQHCYK